VRAGNETANGSRQGSRNRAVPAAPSPLFLLGRLELKALRRVHGSFPPGKRANVWGQGLKGDGIIQPGYVEEGTHWFPRKG
jgi:hypothetical protein